MKFGVISICMKLSNYVVTLSIIFLKCHYKASWKPWLFIHIVIYIHIYCCHLLVTWLISWSSTVPLFHYTLTFHYNYIAAHFSVSNCSAAAPELYWLSNRIKIFHHGSTSLFFFFFIPRWYKSLLAHVTIIAQLLLLKWTPINPTELD